MALTSSEIQSIVSAVLSSIRTNSKTIEQLPPVTSLVEGDYFEVAGGKKVAYSVLRDLIASASTTEQDSLRTLINKCELLSCHFEAGESTATLVVSSKGKSITCSVPIVSTNGAGLMTATDKTKLQSVYDGLPLVRQAADNAKSAADQAQSTANNAVGGVDAINSKIGVSGGIAPLDASGFVPAAHLPGFVDDVVEFNAMVDNVTLQLIGTTRQSTDDGCMVVYDKTRNKFLLAVTRNAEVDVDWGSLRRPTYIKQTTVEAEPTPLANEVGTPTATATSGTLVSGNVPTATLDKYWQLDTNVGGITLNDTLFDYYPVWGDARVFGEDTPNGRVPNTGKIYTCTSDNKTFRWSGSALVAIGSDLALGRTSATAFPGDAGAALEERADLNAMEVAEIREAVTSLETTTTTHASELAVLKENDVRMAGKVGGIAILPFSGSYTSGSGKTPPRNGVWLMEASADVNAYFAILGGLLNTYSIADYHEVDTEGQILNIRTDVIFRRGAELFRWDNEKGKLMRIGGSSTASNTYNVTVEKPLVAGEYYSDIKAETQIHPVLQTVFTEGIAALGMNITFAIGAKSWKTYQYIGPNLTKEQFVDTIENWIDLAGMSAGAEAIVNIDKLCPRKVAGYYTKESAIDALLELQQTSGITYAKTSLVITFKADDYKSETWQFTGQISDFAVKALWKEFGGGGVQTSDTPANGGKDAFSTGGAFDLQQNSFDHLELDQDADNHIIKAVNKKGEEMGQSINLPKSTGTGQQSGSTLNIFLKDQALYGAFGSKITTSIAVRSVSFDGDSQILGVVRSIAIVDPTSNQTLWTNNVNVASSTSATDFKFALDFTPYFKEASQRDFEIVAKDADGNTKKRTITVTAVDVTCVCVQTLNYSTTSVVEKGGAAKNLLMYKFPNNVSKLGVKVVTEMYSKTTGEWKQLGVATVTDSYSHQITINPCNVFGGGEQLLHGSYLIRIQGEDVASGVKGNTIYTSIMCVDRTTTLPIVSVRFNDMNNGTLRLYDTIEVEVAAYTPGKNSTYADVYVDDIKILSQECQSSITYKMRKQLQGYLTDGTQAVSVYAKSGQATSQTISVGIKGSAIEARIKEGALFGYDFASRSNSETDHTISDNGYTMKVTGSNWSSNGFVSYLGDTALRIAENVTAQIPYAPFGLAVTERTTGMALQFAFATNNIKDDNAKLMECYDPDSGAGFYICGNKVVMLCKNGTPNELFRSFRCGEKITVAVVVEPSNDEKILAQRGSTSYSTMKLYVNGEELGAIGYVANSGAILNTKNITFNGTEGDFYLYYLMAYNSYYVWSQAFQNYLCKLTDTDAMVAEYQHEDILDNQNRPTIEKMKAHGIPYYVVVAPQATFDSFDSDINTSTKFECTLIYVDPQRPWRSFKATNVQWRRQGTTSAKRPIKNDRFYLQKPAVKGHVIEITPLFPDYTSPEALRAYDLMSKNYIQVCENTIPVAIITVKVDYSDSSNSNDCSVCDMMNATYRALGSKFMTPAQRAYDGTWTKGETRLTGLEMNHSTANHPIACFRATDENLTDAWFHAKGNWKEDKGEQVALGFKDTPGYNMGCLNYGDFVEVFGRPNQTLDEIEADFRLKPGLDPAKKYLLSLYCGRDYRIMKHNGSSWVRSSGSMKQVNGKWVITGDVLNPVSGYELLTYNEMDWFMGVSSIEDMMAPSTKTSSWVDKLNLKQPTYPAWCQYFECMIDDDQLQEDLAMGRKVPYEIFNVLRFCNSCDYSKAELAETWQAIWKAKAWEYMSVQSLMSYYTFTDYRAAVDQQAKNMQPMFFLEDGCQVVDGVYSVIQ